VPHDELTHEQRERAEVFGTVAEQYDRYRPSYPEQMVDDLLAAAPRAVLDIGCGTGKAARLFAGRGVPVLGVEIDPQMAAVARRHGIEVEVSGFEDWPDRGRRFDLIVCGQAWHWIDPAVGGPKAARLLAAGGTLALFWNFAEPAPDDKQVIDDVYARLAPELLRPPDAGDDQAHLRAVRATGAFSSVEPTTYPAERVWPLEEWLGNLGTQSNHVLLGPRLPALLAGLREALAARGGGVRTTGGTYLIRARV
jgi:SAM-dependent methyltransferase